MPTKESMRTPNNGWLTVGLIILPRSSYWAIAPPEQKVFRPYSNGGRMKTKEAGIFGRGLLPPKWAGLGDPKKSFSKFKSAGSYPMVTSTGIWAVSCATKLAGPTLLAQAVYAEPALVPASPWLDDKPPGKPQFTLTNAAVSGEATIHWQPTGEEKPWLWLVQTKTAGQWRTEILPGNRTVKPNEAVRVLPEVVAVTAVDRCGNASPTALLELKKTVQTPAGR